MKSFSKGLVNGEAQKSPFFLANPWKVLMFYASLLGVPVPLDPPSSVKWLFVITCKDQKNPRAHENRIGTSTPPSQSPEPLPQKKEFCGHGGFSSRKNQKTTGAHKIGAAISSPRIAGRKISDMRLFLKGHLVKPPFFYNMHPVCALQ